MQGPRETYGREQTAGIAPAGKVSSLGQMDIVGTDGKRGFCLAEGDFRQAYSVSGALDKVKWRGL